MLTMLVRNGGALLGNFNLNWKLLTLELSMGGPLPCLKGLIQKELTSEGREAAKGGRG
jgi:hypothetical protein